MFRTALRNMIMHKTRLLMTVLAVLLGVAFVSGTLVFTDTIGDAFRNQALTSLRDVSVVAEPPLGKETGEPLPFPSSLVERLRDLPGAESVTGSVAGITAAAGKDGAPLVNGFDAKGGNWFPQADGKDDRYTFTAGRGPARFGEVALDARSAARGGYRVGDTVRLSIDGPVLTPRLVGIFHTDDAGVSAGGSLTLFDDTTAQRLLAQPGHYEQFLLKAGAGTSEARLAEEAGRILPTGTTVTTAGELARTESAQADDETAKFTQVLLVFALISLFVGIFVIANTYTMLVAQRSRETALLRAIGANRRQVAASVLVEAGLLGLFSGAIGFVVGIGVAAGLRALLLSSGSFLPDGPVVVAPRTFLVAVLVAVVVTMLAALVPAARAAKVPPMAAMSATHAPMTARGIRRLTWTGTVLVVVGAVLVLLGSKGNIAVALGGSLLFLIGFFLLTPALSRPVIGLASPLLTRLGVPGRLGLRNAQRTPRRTAATAAALMVGVCLITGLTVIAISTETATQKEVRDNIRADFTITFTTGGGFSPTLYEAVSKADGVTAASPIRSAHLKLKGTEEFVDAVNTKTIGRLLHPHFLQGSLDALSDGHTMLMSSTTAAFEGFSMGERVPVQYEDGTRGTLRVGGIYEAGTGIPTTMLPLETLQPHLGTSKDASLLVRTTSGHTGAARDTIRRALGDNPLITIETVEELGQASAGAKITVILNVLYGLLALSLVIAVLGVVNTLALSVVERTREIGMLRAIGLQRQETKRMVRLESLLISLFGAVLGVAVGLFLGWAGGKLAAKTLESYEMIIPWGRIVAALLGACAVGVLAAAWPARRAARLGVLAAIKAE